PPWKPTVPSLRPRSILSAPKAVVKRGPSALVRRSPMLSSMPWRHSVSRIWRCPLSQKRSGDLSRRRKGKARRTAREELAMSEHPAELHSVEKIGAYLGCDPALLAQALAWQQHWAARGLRKRLGELLLELQLMSGDTLWVALRAQRLDRLRQCAVF